MTLPVNNTAKDEGRSLEEFDLARPRRIRQLQVELARYAWLERWLTLSCIGGMVAVLGAFASPLLANWICVGAGVSLGSLYPLGLVISAQPPLRERLERLTAEHEALMYRVSAPAEPTPAGNPAGTAPDVEERRECSWLYRLNLLPAPCVREPKDKPP